MMNPFGKKTFVLFACIVLSSLLVAQEPQKEASPNVPKATPAIAVDIFKVGAPKEESLSLSYPGKTISAQTTTIKARANGILLKKFYQEGDFVKTGDVLYKIESDSYEALHNLAKANVQLAEVQMQKTAKDWERIKSLYDSGASNAQEKDTSYWAFESAKASFSSAKASLQLASINLERTTIKATIDGIAGIKQVDVGSLVSDGTPLVDITQTSPLHVEFSIPDIDVIKQKYNIKNGKWSTPLQGKLKASLLVDNAKHKEIGVVEFMDSALNPKTGALKARASFKNADKELLPNQFVKVSLEGLMRNNVLKIPQKAVIQNSLGLVVFVIEDGKAVSKKITVSDTLENEYLVESGIKEGDVIIVNNLLKLKNGVPVKIDKTINDAKQ